VSFCDEFAVSPSVGGFGWVEDTGFLRRCGHALADDGRVFLVDPFEHDGLDERVRAAGEPAGVIQLLDRHGRDCAQIARRLGVPLHRLEDHPPFETIPLATPPRWDEIALWWPGPRALVVAEVLGTARFYRAPGERIAVNPVLRLAPPRRLGRLEPERILVGHGEGIHEDATAALREAIATSRRRIPAYLAGGLRAHVLRRR
jgi:hypothetical protein